MQGWDVLKGGKRGAFVHSVCFSTVRGGAKVPSSRRWSTRHGKSNRGSTSQDGSIKGQSRRHMPVPTSMLVSVVSPR